MMLLAPIVANELKRGRWAEEYEYKLTPSRKTVDLQWELLQYGHRFIGVMHLKIRLTKV